MASIYNFDNELPHLLEGDKYDNDAKGEETGEEIFSWITDEDIINPIPSLDDAFALTDDITGVAATTSASSLNATDSKNMGINPSTTLDGDDDFSTLCVPDDNLATLFPFSDDDSFHADLPKSFEFVQEIEGKAVSADTISAVENALGVEKAPQFILDAPLPSRARSKRSRNPSCNWVSSSLSPTCSATSSLSPAVTITADPEYFAEISNVGRKRKSITKQVIPAGIRKCSHCEATKTPQWRAGPKGPKTLCNACGVRYKSGRLVPEYRPAASPTFTPSKHSNSHRKVLEMRKKKQVPTPFKGNTIRLKVKNYFPNEVGASISMNERVAETELEHEEDDGDNGLPGKQLRDGLKWNCDNYHV